MIFDVPMSYMMGVFEAGMPMQNGFVPRSGL